MQQLLSESLMYKAIDEEKGWNIENSTKFERSEVSTTKLWWKSIEKWRKMDWKEIKYDFMRIEGKKGFLHERIFEISCSIIKNGRIFIN